MFLGILNIVQIYEQDRKILAKIYDWTTFKTEIKIVENSHGGNLSGYLFRDKSKNLNGNKIYASYLNDSDTHVLETGRPNSKWTLYLDILAEKLNASLEFNRFQRDESSFEVYSQTRRRLIDEGISKKKLDFYLNYPQNKFELESYNNREYCIMAPLPKPYSITELILFLPLDISCWKWLGITITVSALVWRISENHWSFHFGAFSYFMGQSQSIKT